MTDEFEAARLKQLADWRAGLEKEGENQVRLMVASGVLNQQSDYRRVAMEWLREKDQVRASATRGRQVREGIRDWGAMIAAVIAAGAALLVLFH